MTPTISPSATPALSPVQLYRTWTAAGQHGGGFLKALTEAWRRGDSTNRARIEAAFPEVVTKYGPGTAFYSHEAEL